jgi:Asp-tRNA(Asn)/Glu-tRNA(Gln) amidotransferase A subunit family amidase
MTDLDLAYTTASALSRLIQRKEISPVEVVETALARIEEVNPRLNCFCFTYPEEALDRARAAERAILAGEDPGPLAGVPLAIKDLTPTRGKRTTLGSFVYEHWVPDRDAAVVEKLCGAGAILVGKTTTPEFAHAGFTESPLWGMTRNPWDPARTPGGSSGGSGAAVASGCVALAEGTDMGGSVRIPAAECGIVGLKPSLGRIPMDILPSLFDNISHFGPLARSVDDAALFLGAAQGPDERDIQSNTAPLDLPRPIPGEVEGKRLALSIDLGFYAVDPEIEANTRAAAEALEDAGAVVEEVELAWSAELDWAWRQIWSVFMAAYFGRHLEEWRDRMDPDVVALMELGFAMSAVDYKRLEILRSEQWRELAKVLTRHDALLCPTMAQPAPPVEAKATEKASTDAEGRFVSRYMTEPFNLVGQCPVLSVPSGFTTEGLPTALSICGRRFDDRSVLEIGKALEEARPWAGRRPPCRAVTPRSRRSGG